MRSVKGALIDKDFDKACNKLSPKVNGADKILYLQERGRVFNLQGNYDASIADWEQAFAHIEKNRMKATISASDLLGQSAGMMLNDNAIPYSGKSYELVFLHTFQMYNYLGRGDLSGALVEARRANNEQTYALEMHHEELAKVSQELQNTPVDRHTFHEALQQGYKAMTFAAGKVKNSFQNPYTHYLSGILYEMADQLDNAYISYKNALELVPGNRALKNNVVRLAKRLQRTSELTHFSKIYGAIEEAPWPRKDQGRLVIFYEDGWIPPKQQIKIPIFVDKHSYIIALPIYDFGWKDITPLSIKAPKRWLGQTEPLCWVRSLAVKALAEEYPKIFLRQLIRLLTKAEIQKQTEKQDPTLGAIVSITNFLSENADRRSWLTLPDAVQVADFFLPEGSYPLEFQSLKTGSKTYEVTVREGETTIVRVVRLSHKLLVDIFYQPKA